MDIHVDGNRSSSENWMFAQTAPIQELPDLSVEQKIVAAKLGQSDEAYARGLLAGDLGRRDIEKRAKQAAQLMERLASYKFPGLRLDSVWLKTFDGKFRFDFALNGSHAIVFVSEDLVNELLESGSKTAEEQIARIIDLNLPTSWMVRAS